MNSPDSHYLPNSYSSLNTHPEVGNIKLIICGSFIFIQNGVIPRTLGLPRSLRAALERSGICSVYMANHYPIVHYPKCQNVISVILTPAPLGNLIPLSFLFCAPITLLTINMLHSKRLFLCLSPQSGGMPHGGAGEGGTCHLSLYSACLAQSLYDRYCWCPTQYPSFLSSFLTEQHA